MEKCYFCDFENRSYEYWDVEKDHLKKIYGPGEVYKGGKKVFPCLTFLNPDDSDKQPRLMAQLEEENGGSFGTSVKINYCPVCGRKLTSDDSDKRNENA